MKVETMKLTQTNCMNEEKEIIALKSLEFECLEYPDIDIENLRFNDVRLYSGDISEQCDLYLKIRTTVNRRELFALLGALKDKDKLWREEDLPCTVKISVNNKIKGMQEEILTE